MLLADDLTALLAAHHEADHGKITVPVRGDKRGNPIAVPNVLRPHLTADPKRPGCMRFTRENPHLVQKLPLGAAGFYQDVDTPAAYAALSQQEERVR